MIDRLLHAQLQIGLMSQAAGKGAGASGENDRSRDWRTQLRRAAAELEREAQAITQEVGGYPGWVLACEQFTPVEGARNGSCGCCRHYDWRGDRCGLRGGVTEHEF